MVQYPTHVLMLANPRTWNGTTLIQRRSPTVRIHTNLSASDETFLTGGSSEQGDTALPSDSGLTVVAQSNPHGESDAKPCDSGFHRGRLRASGRVSGFGRPRHWLGCSRSSPGYNRAGSRLAFPALRPPRP